MEPNKSKVGILSGVKQIILLGKAALKAGTAAQPLNPITWDIYSRS
jgi:hypothetical protein